MKNKFLVRNEHEAVEQLQLLYKSRPMYTGRNARYVMWAVKFKVARMALKTNLRGGDGSPMFIVEVQ